MWRYAQLLRTGDHAAGVRVTEQAHGTTAGFIERAAAAFTASIPEQPANDGYFGPRSVAWRLTGDLTAPIAGVRSLVVQALHPLAMAGVDQHSDWRSDPVARFASTSAYVLTTTYGDRAAADRAAAVVRRIHTHVNGIDTITGLPYAADDPDLLLWVHAIQVDSVLAAARDLGTAVPDADADRYVAEMTAAARLIGMPDGLAPASAAALAEYLTRIQPSLRLTPAAAEAARFLLDPPGMDEEIGGMWSELRDGVLGTLPPWTSELYGFPRVELTDERREEIRQALGVMDAVTIGEPGVLEARQRVELRIREARRG
jgi:uncharacterized protein (DUF2236 family)